MGYGKNRMNIYPRESVEFQPVPVYQNSILVTSNVAFSIVVQGARPSTFTAATILQGSTGFMVTGLLVGTYSVWAQITSAPEIPVIYCGDFGVS